LLAAKFPHGLSALDELPEEKSGEVYRRLPVAPAAENANHAFAQAASA
jgi:hypothetical protein